MSLLQKMDIGDKWERTGKSPEGAEGRHLAEKTPLFATWLGFVGFMCLCANNKRAQIEGRQSHT